MPDLAVVPVFMLVFTRCTAFLISSPIFAIPGIPVLVKAGLAFILTILIYPLAAVGEINANARLFEYGLMVLSEAAVGLAMGMICTIVFNALLMAGQMIDLHIGFAISQLMDPVTGSVNTLLARFLYYVSLATLLCVDAHHGLLWGLAKSYQVLPLSAAEISGSATLFFIRVFADSVTMALKVALPVLGVLLMIDIALGVMGRTAPQMNVFMLGFPFKIMMGLISLAVLLPLMGSIFAAIFDQMQKDLLLLVKGLAG